MKFEEIKPEDIYVKTFQEDIRNYLNGRHLIAIKLRRNEIFLVNDKVYEVFKKLRRNPYVVGFYIGEIKDNFKIGLEFGEILSKIVNHHRVWVKDNLNFLKGENITYKSILKIDENFQPGDYVFVLDKNGNYLGIGRIRKINPLKIQNIIDKGWYIRQSLKKKPRRNVRKAKKVGKRKIRKPTSMNRKVGRKLKFS